jgi:hypothetical protein
LTPSVTFHSAVPLTMSASFFMKSRPGLAPPYQVSRGTPAVSVTGKRVRGSNGTPKSGTPSVRKR